MNVRSTPLSDVRSCVKAVRGPKGRPDCPSWNDGLPQYAVSNQRQAGGEREGNGTHVGESADLTRRLSVLPSLFRHLGTGRWREVENAGVVTKAKRPRTAVLRRFGEPVVRFELTTCSLRTGSRLTTTFQSYAFRPTVYRHTSIPSVPALPLMFRRMRIEVVPARLRRPKGGPDGIS